MTTLPVATTAARVLPSDHLPGLGFTVELTERAVLGLLEMVVARKE